MSLNVLFKGKKVNIHLEYNKVVRLKIADIKENIHKYTNGDVAFVNYSILFTNGEIKIYNSLNDIDFSKPIFSRLNKLIGVR